MTVWRIASWLPKVTNTYSEHAILTAFPRQKYICERASVVLFKYISCLVKTPLVATSPLCLIYANQEQGMVSQNTTVIFGGCFYLG
jgi:hypothetical protein